MSSSLSFSDSRHVVLAAIAVVSVLIVSIRRIVRRLRPLNAYPLPPGPKGLPLIGNALDMPRRAPWFTFENWSQKYGDVVYLQLPKQPVIVLGSLEAATDLLDKRSATYSDRMKSEMINLMRWDWGLATMPYGLEWRAHRRVAHQYFNRDAVKRYQTVQLEEIRAILGRILDEPDRAHRHIHQGIVSIITRVVYGMRIKGLDDPFIQMAETASQGFSLAVVPGAHWMEFIPFLKYVPGWVPGVRGRRLADEYRPFVLATRDVPFDQVKDKVRHGIAEPCMVTSEVSRLQEEYKTANLTSEQDSVARNVAGVLYAAAADTSNASILSFLLAVAMYPEVQDKARAELDAKVGSQRLPDFADLESLPYVEAITLETLRWIPVTPIGAAHRVMEDDVYRGYKIPKGSIVMVNAWQLLHDPEEYPAPDVFNPDRFMKDGKINRDIRDPSGIVFGFGRRICPGRHLAYYSLAMTIASLLHVFNIRPGTDESGNPVKLTTEVKDGIVANVVTTPRSFTPRSASARHVVRETLQEQERSNHE